MEKEGKRSTKSKKSQSGGECDRTYPRRQKRRKQIELQGEFQKMKPPTFNGEKEGDEKSWLLNMTKYFQVYDYERNLKATLTIY